MARCWCRTIIDSIFSRGSGWYFCNIWQKESQTSRQCLFLLVYTLPLPTVQSSSFSFSELLDGYWAQTSSDLLYKGGQGAKGIWGSLNCLETTFSSQPFLLHTMYTGLRCRTNHEFQFLSMLNWIVFIFLQLQLATCCTELCLSNCSFDASTHQRGFRHAAKMHARELCLFSSSCSASCFVESVRLSFKKWSVCFLSKATLVLEKISVQRWNEMEKGLLLWCILQQRNVDSTCGLVCRLNAPQKLSFCFVTLALTESVQYIDQRAQFWTISDVVEVVCGLTILTPFGPWRDSRLTWSRLNFSCVACSICRWWRTNCRDHCIVLHVKVLGSFQNCVDWTWNYHKW